MYSENIIIEAAIKKSFLEMKYYLMSFQLNCDKKALVNERDTYGRPAIFYSAFLGKFASNIS